MHAPGDWDAIRLGDRFVIHPQRGQLLEGGARVSIGARALDLLCALARQPGETVSKRVLLDRVWPDVVVEENNLQVQISSLRKALGSEAITTVPGRGYRLSLRVNGHEPQPAPPAVSNPASHWQVDAHAGLVGRAEDVARLHELLSTHVLVSVVGTGGVGKTSLARIVAKEWAASHQDGIVWVELAPVADPDLVGSTVADAAQLQLPTDRPALEAAADLLARTSLLVVLDNAEHLAIGVAKFASALVHATRQAGGGARILVTSRQPLQDASEVVYRLDGLRVDAIEPGASAVSHDDAVALFAMRALAADARFCLNGSNTSAVAHICRQLDGLPLAIEMAAARVPSLGVSGVAAHLDQHWHLLSARGRNVSPRHQTLRATLDWSHALLEPAQQRTFRRLAVFNGGFTLGAACSVAREAEGDDWEIGDALADLIDKSMVAADANDPPRYRLLDTVRTYGLEALEAAGERAEMQQRHASWCLKFFLEADDAWWERPAQAWSSDVLPELGNLAAALSWSLDDAQDAPLGVSLAAAALPTWSRLAREESSQARALADRALARANADTELRVQARLHVMRGIYYGCVDAPVALESLRQGVALGESSAADRDHAHALIECARMFTRVGDFGPAGRLLARAQEMCDQASAPLLRGLLALAWGFTLNMQRRQRESRPHFEAALSIFDGAQAGYLTQMARNDLADCVWAEGELGQAAALLRQVIEHSHSALPSLCDHTGVPQMNLASVLAECGDLANATAWAREAWPLLRQSEKCWGAYDCLSLIATLRGEFEDAACLHGLSDASYAATGMTVREPNESRIHARVASALRASLGDEVRTSAIARGALMDDATAWRLALK